MKVTTLSDVCEISSGGTPSRSNPSYYQGEIPWAKITDIENAENGVIFDTEEKITVEGLKSIRDKLFPKGTLLFAMYGSIGKVAIAGRELSTNQAILGIRPKSTDQVNLKYLKIWFERNKQKLENQGRGVALQNLSATMVRNLAIPLPPMGDQIRIATVLTRTEKLIAKRKESIKALDELLKNTFLEMFGDPVKNDMGWSTKRLGTITIDKINYGIVQPGSFKDDGIPIIRVGDFVGFDIDDSELKRVEKSISEKHKNSILKGNEILLACVGATIGKIALVSERHRGYNIVRATARIRPNDEIDRYYLAYFLSNQYSQTFFKNSIRAVGQPTLNIKQIEELPIIIPPLALQRQFNDFLKKTEVLRKWYTQSLEELENLYGSLSQRAFKGELDLSKVAVDDIAE